MNNEITRKTRNFAPGILFTFFSEEMISRLLKCQRLSTIAFLNLIKLYKVYIVHRDLLNFNLLIHIYVLFYAIFSHKKRFAIRTFAKNLILN